MLGESAVSPAEKGPFCTVWGSLPAFKKIAAGRRAASQEVRDACPGWGFGEVTWPRVSRVPHVHDRPRRGVRIRWDDAHKRLIWLGFWGTSAQQRVSEFSQWSSLAVHPLASDARVCGHTCTHTHPCTCSGLSESRPVSLPPWSVVSPSRLPVSPAGNREQLV